MFKKFWLLALLPALWASPAFANSGNQQMAADDVSVLVFAGKNVRGFQSYPFKSTPGDQKLLGVSAAWTPLHLPYGFRAGVDAGATLRKDGDRFTPGGTTGEFWAGPTLRHKGVALGPVLLKGGITLGLSAVTGSKGLEREREQDFGGDAALLYYIGPEVAVSLKSIPNIDLVYRLHHRSGAKHVSYLPTIGGMGDTNNANSFGIRYHF